uniref:G domain-containing protein n=1 Tax=Amphimedon queenslandica TaxID=400682 RepID=A0A1X7UC68_AMPQE
MAEKPDEDVETETSTIADEELMELPVPGTLTIFVIGKTGAGKSQLINSLLGEEKALVSHGLQPTNHEPLEEYKGMFYGVPTTIYDTRGIGDPNSDDSKLIKEFKKGMKSKGDRYLIFICQEFARRLDNDVHKFLKDLAKNCKRNYNVWKKSILVLTKANSFKPPIHKLASDGQKEMPDNDVKGVKMKMIMEDWCINVKSTLTKYGVPEEIILGMNVCCTSWYDEEIPIYRSWKETLMKVCIEAQQDWDINEERRRRQVAARNIGAVAGGLVSIIVPVIGPYIGTTLGAIIGAKLGRGSFEKSMKKSETEKYDTEAINFKKKERKFFFLSKYSKHND